MNSNDLVIGVFLNNPKYYCSMNIVFVCRQNVFRSMSAEYLLKKFCFEHEIQFNICSAGTHATPDRAWSAVYEALMELGITVTDIYRHHKQTKLATIANTTDFFICMTKDQSDIAKALGCKYVYLFNELAFGEQVDLYDDAECTDYDSVDVYCKKVVFHIAQGIPRLVARLQTMNA